MNILIGIAIGVGLAFVGVIVYAKVAVDRIGKDL